MHDDEVVIAAVNPVTLFDERVPPELLRKIRQCISESYPKACEEVRNHVTGRSAYLFGHHRYAHIEHALQNLNFPGVDVRIRCVAGDLFRIAQVFINGVILTASANIYDDKLPKPSRFREKLSRLTTIENPKSLFEIEREAEEGMDDVELYGIINHGKDKNNLGKPAFIGILFPDKTYQHIIGSVDVLKRFPLEVENAEPAVKTSVKPEVRIKKKRVNE